MILKFAVSQIQKDALQQPMTFDREVDVSEIETLENDILKAFPVHVVGSVVLQGEEMIFSFNISGKVILPCARTLVEVPYDFDIDALEIFTTALTMTEEDEEDEVHFIDGEVIDLTPLIKENILLEIPYRVYSKNEEVLRNALVQGDGWELVEESEEVEEDEEQPIDPRLNKLKQFMDKNNNEK
ncbi:MAG TPA: YceD family protein [Bacillota bacterium]|nr:YceD family protein [Bacillota bacterium]